jgi:hypothetical protein
MKKTVATITAGLLASASIIGDAQARWPRRGDAGLGRVRHDSRKGTDTRFTCAVNARERVGALWRDGMACDAAVSVI